MEKQKPEAFSKQNHDESLSGVKEPFHNRSPAKPEEKNPAFHLELLNKLAGENQKPMKPKKSPEEIVKARLNSLLRNPGILLRRDTKDLNSKTAASKEENTFLNNLTSNVSKHIGGKDLYQNCTSEMKHGNVIFSKSPPQVKTEPKDSKPGGGIINTVNLMFEATGNAPNQLTRKINEIKGQKQLANKANLMASPKQLGLNSLQKSAHFNNLTPPENLNGVIQGKGNTSTVTNNSLIVSNHNHSVNAPANTPYMTNTSQLNTEGTNHGLNSYAKFNQTLMNVGLINKRQKAGKSHETGKTLNLLRTLNNPLANGKFINLKKGKYSQFLPGKSTNEKKAFNSQTNENISINSTSHNISVSSNQIHLATENRLADFRNKNEQMTEFLTYLDRTLDELLDNVSGEKEKLIENIKKAFEAMRRKLKGFEPLIHKGQEFGIRLCEELLMRCDNEQMLKDLLDKIGSENERLKDDQENDKKIRKEGLRNENNNMNSSSTNCTNTIHKNKVLNSNFSKENNPQEFKTLMKENQKLKNVILDQQNSLYQMKEKESKLIKLLQGAKKRGIDLDEIFREEVVGDNAENSDRNNESEVGNLHLADEPKEKYITEKSNKFKPIPEFLRSPSQDQRFGDDIDRNQADESIVNESAESSFNYYGKPDSLPTSLEYEHVKKIPERKITNTGHLNSKLKDKLKLNLSNIQRKTLVQSSSDNNVDNKKKNFEKMAKIFQKKMSEQTHQYKAKKDEHEEMLKNIEEMGEIWKKMKK